MTSDHSRIVSIKVPKQVGAKGLNQCTHTSNIVGSEQALFKMLRLFKLSSVPREKAMLK